MAFEKAVLEVEKGSKIRCQFNPTEYDVTNTAKYTEKTIPGGRGTISQFISGDSPTLSLSLMFDTYIPPTLDDPSESGSDVSLLTQKVVQLTKIKGTLHRPPIVTFVWGSLSFRGIVTEVKQKFTMFLPSGIPVRAKLDLTFREAPTEGAGRESPLESPDRTKYRRIKEGEYLWNYAQEEYGSPGMWRIIASENNILNPLDVEPGQTLKFPVL